MTDVITGGDFKLMVRNAAALISNNKDKLNELNVFPVPDGDTGTNMSLTINAAADDISRRSDGSLCEVADAVAAAMLRGARGNSGVIMSLLFRGIARTLKDKETAGAAEFADALQSGVETAYKSVMKPTEGTILTVSRLSAGAAKNAAAGGNYIEMLTEALSEASRALEETPKQNAVLAKAGVVDAGGMGYVFILQGFLEGVSGRIIDACESGASSAPTVFDSFNPDDIEFAYCTEFIVTLTGKNNDAAAFRAYIESMGDSAVVVHDDEIIKVHVHTNNPGAVIEEALTLGPLSRIKIDNMKEQHSGQVISEQEKNAAKKPVKIEKKYGFVSVAAGDGVSAIFKDLGVDVMVRGGQTMNPSTEDILAAVENTPAEVVFVLPNNKNIIMAAEQAGALTDRKIIIVPSKTIPQGISALLAFDPEIDDEQNGETMSAALKNVRTGQITYATRDSVFDGEKIAEGDYIALDESKLCGNGRDVLELARRLGERLDIARAGFVTVFYGENVSEDDAQVFCGALTEGCGGAVEVNLLCGDQPVYYYIVGVE